MEYSEIKIIYFGILADYMSIILIRYYFKFAVKFNLILKMEYDKIILESNLPVLKLELKLYAKFS